MSEIGNSIEAGSRLVVVRGWPRVGRVLVVGRKKRDCLEDQTAFRGVNMLRS